MGDRLHTFSFKDGFKKTRKEHGYTQQSFAEKFGICIETIRNWEQGRNVPELDTIYKLCEFFECDMDYLFNNISCHDHDTQFIHDKTGLSADAINVLYNLNKIGPNELYSIGNSLSLGKHKYELPTRIISELLEHEELIKLLLLYFLTEDTTLDTHYKADSYLFRINMELSKMKEFRNDVLHVLRQPNKAPGTE